MTEQLEALAELEAELHERERTLTLREATLAGRAGSLLAAAQALYDDVLGGGPLPTTSSAACGGGRAWPDGRMLARRPRGSTAAMERYAAVPFVWLALALLNPFLLFIPPLITLALWKAMQYGSSSASTRRRARLLLATRP